MLRIVRSCERRVWGVHLFICTDATIAFSVPTFILSLSVNGKSYSYIAVDTVPFIIFHMKSKHVSLHFSIIDRNGYFRVESWNGWPISSQRSAIAFESLNCRWWVFLSEFCLIDYCFPEINFDNWNVYACYFLVVWDRLWLTLDFKPFHWSLMRKKSFCT